MGTRQSPISRYEICSYYSPKGGFVKTTLSHGRNSDLGQTAVPRIGNPWLKVKSALRHWFSNPEGAARSHLGVDSAAVAPKVGYTPIAWAQFSLEAGLVLDTDNRCHLELLHRALILLIAQDS